MTKIYLDNNFFTSYEACNDDNYKEQVKNAFIRKKFSLYCSVELIEEMLGIAETGVSEKLKDRLKLFLDMFPRRLLNYHGRIIQNELGLASHNVFLPTSEVNEIRTMIPYIIRGEVKQKDIIDYLNVVKKNKKEHEDYYKGIQNHIRIKTGKISKSNMSYEEYLNNFPKEQLITFIKKVISKENIRDIDSVASLIANSLRKFRYFNKFCNIIVALHYKYFILNNTVKGSDYYDAFHLLYLTDLDAFITNDKRMIWLCETIFKDKKVITFENIRNHL